MLSGDTPSIRTGTVRLRTKFVAAFLVQALFITLMTVGIEQWRVFSGRGSLISDYIFVGLIALVVSFLFAFFAAQLIIRPALDVAETAKLLAEGDLTQRTPVTTADEIGSLAEAFNAMAGNLERTLTKLQQSQSQLKSVFEIVGSRSRTVVERVDEQRTVVADTYRSIDQLNGGVRKITTNVESLSAASEETSASMLQMEADVSSDEIGRAHV